MLHRESRLEPQERVAAARISRRLGTQGDGLIETLQRDVEPAQQVKRLQPGERDQQSFPQARTRKRGLQFARMGMGRYIEMG